MARGWRTYVTAALSLGVILVGLIGAMWAIGAAGDGHTTGVGADLTALFDALFAAAPALVFIPAAMVCLGAAYALARQIGAATDSSGIEGYR
jgi:hypothetical protein